MNPRLADSGFLIWKVQRYYFGDVAGFAVNPWAQLALIPFLPPLNGYAADLAIELA